VTKGLTNGVNARETKTNCLFKAAEIVLRPPALACLFLDGSASFSTCDECGFKKTLLYGKGFLSRTRYVEDADKKPRLEGLEPSSARGP
jgi:hypothetical protein